MSNFPRENLTKCYLQLTCYLNCLRPLCLDAYLQRKKCGFWILGRKNVTVFFFCSKVGTNVKINIKTTWR